MDALTTLFGPVGAAIILAGVYLFNRFNHRTDRDKIVLLEARLDDLLRRSIDIQSSISELRMVVFEHLQEHNH